jgi:mxaJ protein
VKRALLLVGVAVIAADAIAARAHTRELRVCADPNNMPFSNRQREGFENRLADMLAADMKVRVRYVWWAQRRGFFRTALNAGECDVVPGVATSVERAWTTSPYYRSTYVFVTRRDRHISVQTFDDPALRSLRIGVQTVGDDYANTPPVAALARRGLGAQLVGYSIVGDYSSANPPARIIDAVARGDVDIAVVWGPLAGYFATRARVKLDLVPVEPQIDTPFLPFVFDISMGVRRGDTTLHRAIDQVLQRRKREIRALLADYGVPLK